MPGNTYAQGQAPPPSQEEQDPKDALDQMTGLFYSGEPKNAGSGLMEGVGNLATGATAGAAGLAGATLGGLRNHGVLGGIAGAGVGLCGLAGLTGYGAYSGARQAGRGVYNIPDSIHTAYKGDQLWDSSTGKSVTVKFAEDFKSLPANDDDIKARAKKLYRDVFGDGGSNEHNAASNPHRSSSNNTITAAGESDNGHLGMDANGNVTD